MTAPFVFDQTFEFALAPGALWEVLDRTHRYPVWWRWLRVFDTDGVAGLSEGAEARCVVRGPLPYTLRFTVAVHRVVSGRLVGTEVSGDLEGPARLELEPIVDGVSARLAWSVRVANPRLAVTARLARPLMEWGHDRVVRQAVRAFRAHTRASGAD